MTETIMHSTNHITFKKVDEFYNKSLCTKKSASYGYES